MTGAPGKLENLHRVQAVLCGLATVVRLFPITKLFQIGCIPPEGCGWYVNIHERVAFVVNSFTINSTAFNWFKFKYFWDKLLLSFFWCYWRSWTERS